MSEQTAGQTPPRDDEPGGESTPADTQGSGPVTLEDRTRERGTGQDDTTAPGSNQAKTEPMPSTAGHRDPNAPLQPPLLEDMNVGVADPQSPSHPAAAHPPAATPAPGPGDLGGAGAAPSEERPLASAGSSTGRATGPENPVSSSAGSSHRAPGLEGRTGADEAVETDVASSAAHMTRDGAPSLPATDSPGDPQGVPVPSHEAAAGTSEEHAAVRGARTPSTSD